MTRLDILYHSVHNVNSRESKLSASGRRNGKAKGI
jgi:hypothetical protein